VHLRHRNKDELSLPVSSHGRGVHYIKLRSYQARGPNGSKTEFPKSAIHIALTFVVSIGLCTLTAVGIRCPLPAKVGTNFPPTSGGRSAGIVRLRITATEFSFFIVLCTIFC
jgi:hypothetical protein